MPPRPSCPLKRKKKDGPAPIYQVKVGLRGAKPRIWRRLEVPGDLSLAVLHHVIQVAFGWHDSHMHVFETPYGDFGWTDRELGHRAEGPVTLEQVARRATDKIRYTYDFGDNWDHEILLARVSKDLEASAVFPQAQLFSIFSLAYYPRQRCGAYWARSKVV